MAGPVRRGHDEARGVVGLHAAVEQVARRLHDPPRVQHVLHGHPPLVEGFGVVGGVPAVDDLDPGQLLVGRAVLVHVTGEGELEHLGRAEVAVEGRLEARPGDGSGRRPSRRGGSSHASFRVAVHRSVNGHRVAHARLDGAARQADERLGARAPARAVHVEVQADPEILGEGERRRRIVAVIRQHPVDVPRVKAGVAHGVAHRLGTEGPGAAPRVPGVGRLAHTDDAVLVLDPRHGSLFPQSVRTPALYSARRG